MKIILAGLMLVAALAQATPVIRPVYSGMSPQFGPILHMVTEEDTPEWAKLPEAIAWYEIRFNAGGTDSTEMVLRGVLLMGPDWRIIPKYEIVPVGEESANNPEPGTFLLMAAGAVLLIGSRYRQARSKPCWRR
jgi:hypothetical protein